MQPVTIEDSVIASGGVVDVVPSSVPGAPPVSDEDTTAEQHKAETRASLEALHQSYLQWQAEVQAYRDRRNRAINEAADD